jgi:hypothetical protein
MSTPNGGGYRCLCPACGSPMRIRTSEVQTPVFKTMYGQCTNVACGGSYVGSLGWEFRLNTPGTERPLTDLPLAPAAMRHKIFRSQQPATRQLDMLDAIAG